MFTRTFHSETYWPEPFEPAASNFADVHALFAACPPIFAKFSLPIGSVSFERVWTLCVCVIVVFIEGESNVTGWFETFFLYKKFSAKVPLTSLTVSAPFAAKYWSRFFSVTVIVPPWLSPCPSKCASAIGTFVAKSTNSTSWLS